MADDNIFDFEAFKKRLDELKKDQEKKKGSKEQDGFSKMFELYSSLLTPPSQEEIDKAVTQLAEGLEKAAKAIREMSASSEAEGESTDETEEEE